MKKEEENPGVVPVGPGLGGDFILHVPDKGEASGKEEEELGKTSPEPDRLPSDPARASEYEFISSFMEPM